MQSLSTISKKPSLKGVCITQKNERMAKLVLTVRAHVGSSAQMHALRLVYAEAVLSGAGKYSREAWQDALGNIGADISVSLDAGDIDFSVTALDTASVKTCTLLTTLFAEPTFSESELVRIKTYLTNNLTRAKDDARTHAYRMFMQQVFQSGDRRTVYDIDALIQEVATITREELLVFHRSLWGYAWFYTVGGSTETSELFKKTLTRIQNMHVSEPVQEYVTKDTQHVAGVKVCLHSVPHKQNIELSIGGVFPKKRTDVEYPAFVFGMAVLGLYGGFTGRLMSIVREKEGLTYGIYGRAEEVTSEESGVWRISTFFSPKDAVQGITSTLREIARIQKEGITEDELKRFKVILNTRYALVNDSLLKRVGEAHSLMKVGTDAEQYETFKDGIQKMTRKEVNNALSKYLDCKNLIISGAGPVAHIQKELKKFEKA